MENPASGVRGIPNSDQLAGKITSEFKSPALQSQGLILAVFGRSYVVVHEPIGNRFRKRAPSRIRAWRAEQ
jgi:hypothetical protein